MQTFAKLNTSIYGTMWGPSEFIVTGTLKNYERAERLKDLHLPVLFTVGRYDEATPETAEYYRSRLPGAKLVVFEDASHMHHHEKRAEYLQTIRSFMRELQASAN